MTRTERTALATERTLALRPDARIERARTELAAKLSYVGHVVAPDVDLAQAETMAAAYSPRSRQEILGLIRTVRGAEAQRAAFADGTSADETATWLFQYREIYRREMAARQATTAVAPSAGDGGADRPAERQATTAQRQYLRRLGYRGSFEGMTLRAASERIETFQRLTAADVDDFTGPEHTW